MQRMCEICSRKKFCGNETTAGYCTGFMPQTETRWEIVRDEVAGMLADGQPLEDVIVNLEKRKNEMAKANLLKAMNEMKKPKQMTEQEYLQTCTTEQLIRFLLWYPNNVHGYPKPKKSIAEEEDAIREWLKQQHREE